MKREHARVGRLPGSGCPGAASGCGQAAHVGRGLVAIGEGGHLVGLAPRHSSVLALPASASARA
eukprot:2570586-Rhodomonas_salina.1